LRLVPDDKVVVLGLVSTKTPLLESADELQLRIRDAAQHFPLAQLALSPQCGFASSILGNEISEQAESAKLELVVRVANRVWH
jgi:5-methyltetrahydropteroyltriglutamate--homocysteine methyltransferase